jgi:glycopeptide antibiotics resistance protein
MRFLLGVLVGYRMRGKKKRLITVLATVAFIVYIILPAIALLALHLNLKHKQQPSPVQIIVPSRD